MARTGGRLLAMFAGFALAGYFLKGLIPVEWVQALFGGGRVYSVPLAATLWLGAMGAGFLFDCIR